MSELLRLTFRIGGLAPLLKFEMRDRVRVNE